MSPLTMEQAIQATNPDAPQEAREQAALAIVAGQAANEAYWNSRTELEALRAQADGHGVIVRGAAEEGGDPTVVHPGTPAAVEGTATDAGTELPPPNRDVPPDNSTEAVAQLRSQLRRAGIDPVA